MLGALGPGRRLGLSWLAVFRAAEPAAREAGGAKESVNKQHRYANDNEEADEDGPSNNKEDDHTEVSVHGVAIWEWFACTGTFLSVKMQMATMIETMA